MKKTKFMPVSWGDHFKIRRLGASTYYVVWKETNEPVSPDFREYGLARAWIKENYESVAFERVVLK